MVDPTTESRSAETDTSQPSSTNGPASGAANHGTSGTADAPVKPTGRQHPTVISGRVSHSTKGRAKDIARARGISLCQLVRTAVRDALDTYEKSPNAV